jgi:putative peptidoglycan lipid II flippase
LALGLALPAAIALAALAEPIVRVLFQRGAFSAEDTSATAAALAAFALGLPGHVLVKTFSPIFFAREDTATPMYAALFGFVIAIAGSLALLPVLGHVGIALAISLSGWASAGLLGFLIARRIGFSIDREAKRRLPRIVLAAAIMGAAVEAAHRVLGPWLDSGAAGALYALVLAALIAFGVAVYVALLRILKVTSPHDLVRAIGSGKI